MPNECRRAASAIADILAIERLYGRARKVDDLDSARQPNSPAGARQTNVEFRVLIVTRAFVVASDGQETRQIEECMVAVIDELRFAGTAMRCSSSAENRVLHRRDGRLKAFGAAGCHRNYHRFGVGAMSLCDKGPDIPGWVVSMRIETDEPPPPLAKGAHGQVHAGALNALRIEDDLDAGVARGDLGEDIGGAIRAATVGDHCETI